MSTVAVGIRFEREVWERHSASAQARGLPLGTYIRQLLEEQERVGTALAEIQSSLERSAGETAKGTDSPAPRAAILEMLLILRQLAGGQKVAIAQAEVKRQGIEPLVLR